MLLFRRANRTDQRDHSNWAGTGTPTGNDIKQPRGEEDCSCSVLEIATAFPTLSCWFPHCHFRCCLSPVAKIARPVIFIDTDTASQVVLTVRRHLTDSEAFKK